MTGLNTDKKQVIFLMGATASGKTDLVIALAQRMPISIISVDSAMIYRGMDIGTAKPDKIILEKYPHSLIDICNADESYCAAQFNIDANVLIKQAFAQGKTPLLVGGTSFYFAALGRGLAPLPDSEKTIRDGLIALEKSKGVAFLYQQLLHVDSISAKRINPNDKQRIMRALEVFKISGEPLSKLQQQKHKNALSYPITKIILTPPKALLDQKIATRFNIMLENGLVAEVAKFYQSPNIKANMPSMRSVGYRQVWQYLDAKLDYATMVEKALTASRQLCKRQNTWLRNEENAHRLIKPNIDDLIKLVA